MPPSRSQTRNSSPSLLTETALPRMPTCAPEIEDVWPQRRLPELIDRAVEVERTKYKDSVLSGCATRRYGCEYDMEVGFDRPGPLGRDPSLGVPGKGDGERVEGEGADRHAESVKACSSAAVANRDSRSSPVGESLSSCTPTVHPDR
jgi:hypothetical protein